jgi:hypothetical protein
VWQAGARCATKNLVLKGARLMRWRSHLNSQDPKSCDLLFTAATWPGPSVLSQAIMVRQAHAAFADLI